MNKVSFDVARSKPGISEGFVQEVAYNGDCVAKIVVCTAKGACSLYVRLQYDCNAVLQFRNVLSQKRVVVEMTVKGGG